MEKPWNRIIRLSCVHLSCHYINISEIWSHRPKKHLSNHDSFPSYMNCSEQSNAETLTRNRSVLPFRYIILSYITFLSKDIRNIFKIFCGIILEGVKNFETRINTWNIKYCFFAVSWYVILMQLGIVSIR